MQGVYIRMEKFRKSSKTWSADVDGFIHTRSGTWKKGEVEIPALDTFLKEQFGFDWTFRKQYINEVLGSSLSFEIRRRTEMRLQMRRSIFRSLSHTINLAPAILASACTNGRSRKCPLFEYITDVMEPLSYQSRSTGSMGRTTPGAILRCKIYENHPQCPASETFRLLDMSHQLVSELGLVRLGVLVPSFNK